MKPKRLVALFLVVGALSAGVFFKKTAQRHPANEISIAEERTLNPGLSPAFVTRIEIRQAGDSPAVLLKDASGEWTLESRYGAPARKDTVEALVKEFSDLRGEVRADAQDLLTDFKIDDKQGIRIQFDLTVGKSQATYLSPLRPTAVENFVRDGGSHEVLVVKKNLLGVLGLWNKDSKIDYKAFADLRVMSADISKISRLELASNGRVEVSLTHRDPEGSAPAVDEWRFDSSGEPADAMEVKRLLNQLSNLFGVDALDPKTEHGFQETPSVRLREKIGTEEKEKMLFFGKADPDSKTVAVAVRPENRVFAVPEGSLAPFAKKKTDFVPKAS